MKQSKKLNINGTLLQKEQLKNHLQKIAASHNTIQKSSKDTYPIPNLLEDYEIITETYKLLNEHLKLKINIHPAGEWLLDNYYIIEETVKQIQKELPLKKYTNLVGIANGEYAGFSRIYVLSAEIVAYTENKIEKENLEEYLKSYQTKKTLSMEEIWNIGIFLQIALIHNISEICKKIASSQFQKYKAENIAERLIENKIKQEQIYKLNTQILKKEIKQDVRYPFIEYMSYILKRYGKKGISYQNALEEIVEKLGLTVSDIIQKEHFDIAIQKVLIGNSITSLKTIQRINFLEIFEKINGVEDILKQDPSNIYSQMDYNTKEYYRNKIKEISKRTKISEIYIANQILELAKKAEGKKAHIGYYLIDNGIDETYEKLKFNNKKTIKPETKVKEYIALIVIITILLSIFISYLINTKIQNKLVSIITFIIFLLPISELVVQVIQSILNKTVKPKIIPKLDYSKGIPKDKATIVVIPTIIKSKQKVRELIKKLEIYYIANKSENLYFALLGDCSESSQKEEPFDKEVIEEGKKQIQLLNEKYKNKFPIFHFLYRKREWSEKEGSYLGWERKRGLLNQFNEYLLGNIKDIFLCNTIEIYKNENNKDNELPKIKYVITLDADTDLTLNTAYELIGAMSHILNKPVIDKKKNIVVEGYGIMQPRVGINLDISLKTTFTKIFAGAGGIDCYTNAISDIYQDNFKEGIFTGKGIYDLEVFSKVLNKELPENTILSHDLLEGCYLRCGLVTDILIMDGYPTKYISFMARLSRWIRGDWQITKWIKNKKLNLLSRYKILDNIRRSLIEISIIVAMIYVNILAYMHKNSISDNIILLSLIVIIPQILELINKLIFKKQGEHKQKTYTQKITGTKGILARMAITLGCLPFRAYISLKSICKTIYRKHISKKHMLEWTTSEEAEKQAKSDLISYYKQMLINVIIGVIAIIIFKQTNIFNLILGILWIITPFIMYKISKEIKPKTEKITDKEKEYIVNIAKETWEFFDKYLNEENNYLITDNFQEDRKQKVVDRTSSTNIGLSLLAIISSYDLKFINLEKTLNLINNIINTILGLEKWNGHLYNWYETKTKKPLIPRYISTVDSGNFVGYLYIVKTFLQDIYEELEENPNELYNKQKEQIKNNIIYITKLIDETDFSKLYSKEHQIFSIGFNIEENKLTDSFYDLLASEARQASFVAIAKKDVPAKHWNRLSRTLTILGKYKGLISWSGTSFEYLMPNINIPKYKGSLLDESSQFMIMSQLEYCKKLQIPWGISEAGFNLKDLQGNYQYKAFGIPWLGLKRGLADEMVVATYGSVLAIVDRPKLVIDNLKMLEKYGMHGKYGFYESIDFTPERIEKGKKASIVKTYMAHHQALILLSINNYINNNILQQRFVKNPEIASSTILLQETMPESAIITKENKEKIEKPKYQDYEDYNITTYNKIDERLIRGNVISNEDYVIAINQKGEGFSRYKDIYINRFNKTGDYPQGIIFAIKNIKTQNIWSSLKSLNQSNYKVSFMPDKIEQIMEQDNIKTKIETIISPNNPTEIRRITMQNRGLEEETLEITGYFEPVISKKAQDEAHPVFNNLFLIFDYDENTNSLIIKRKKRNKDEKEIYLGVNFITNESDSVGKLEYEIDKEKFMGRGNAYLPNDVKNSTPLSKKIGLAVEGMVVLKRTVRIKPQEKIELNFVISIGENKNTVLENMKQYKIKETVDKAFEISKAQVEAQSRYLRIKGKEIEQYQKILSYIIFTNPSKKINLKNLPKHKYMQSELWKYGISGDLPIILVKVKDVNDIDIIKEILKAYEFFRIKNISIELVILDEEKHSYENYVREEIDNIILNSHMSYLKNIKGGIFELSKNEIDKNDIQLLEFVATLIINSNKGTLKNAINEIEEEYLDKTKEIRKEENMPIIEEETKDDIDLLKNIEEKKYFNEYGAFSEDGKEYIITINKNKRLPTVWSHIMANDKFGTLVTENMGGYTWYKNSRLNRITSWANMPNYDIPSEIIYIKDEENKKTWSLGLGAKSDNNNYNVVYGFGYAKYIHKSDGIEQQLEVFVPREDSVKIQILKLKNTTPNRKKLKLYYYIKPVLGEDEQKLTEYIHLKYDKNNNIIIAENLYNNDFTNYVYVSSSEKIKSYTGDKKLFFGEGGIINPNSLQKDSLNNENSLGRLSCIAYELEIEVESFGEKEISILLGAEENLIDSKNTCYKYSKIQNCKQELEKTKNYWKNTLETVQVYTPIESINILLNGWIVYQTINSRLMGKTGYYQSGGAYGFRDQLQDTLGLKYIDSNYMKNQIVKHSKHQFEEGDVEHWWHEDTQRGIRTRFSDDLLWLPYVVSEYIEFTGDYQILDIEVPYLKGNLLEEVQDEKYDKYIQGDKTGTIYEHCIKSIEKGINLGEHGLPKIGSGDWNDGMSEVGNKGKGESVWLGFFLYNVLDRFIPLIKLKNPESELVSKYEKIKQDLKKALNTSGWDGRWYKRAYTDDNQVLGSMENEECRIDSIAQSWATISNAGDNDKKYISMESLENHLVDKENGIIKLLDPPFEKSSLEPGYIKAYLPGVRENGGQYTHGAIWAIIAETMLGFGDKALELYKMINPIEHSRTKETAQKYKVEPYVIAADIYGANNLAGRGGWTWYTGSSSWYYKTGIEYILGLHIKNKTLYINPCIPKEWKNYSIRYKYKNTLYNINIKNQDGKNTGVSKIVVDGENIDLTKGIILQENSGVINIEVEM